MTVVSITATKHLVDVLKEAARIAPKKSTLAVLEHVKLTLQGDDITVEATDLRMFYRRTIFISDLGVAQPFSIMLHRGAIMTLKAPVAILLDASSYRFNLIKYTPAVMPEEFPKNPSLTDGIQKLNLPKEYFADLASCAISAATSEVRPILTGICHRGDSVVATDGLRLYRAEQDATWVQDVVLPAEHAVILQKAFNKTGAYMLYGNYYASYKSNGYEIFVRLIDGTYPDVSRIIPSSHKAVAAFGDIRVWLEALEQAILYHKTQRKKKNKDDNNTVLLKSGDNGTAQLSAQGPDENFYVELPFTSDRPVEISFNAQYLKDAIKQVGGDAYCLFNEPNKPFLMKNNNKHIALISPISMR